MTAPEMRTKISRSARARRIAMNLTQSELSERSGVGIATIKRFEIGNPTTTDTLLAIAEVLDALAGFAKLFPLPEARKLEDLQPQTRKRARKGA